MEHSVLNKIRHRLQNALRSVERVRVKGDIGHDELTELGIASNISGIENELKYLIDYLDDHIDDLEVNT